MSLLFGPREHRLDTPTDNLVEMLRRRMPSVGGPVTQSTALTHSAVYECVDLIADLVSGFPAQRFRDVDGRKQRATGATVVENPSTEVDPVNWRRILVVGWLLRGYAAGLVTGMRGAWPTGIELVHPDRVSVERLRKDSPVVWRLDSDVIERWPRGPLWVAPGKMMNPGDPVGRSVLEFAMAEIGTGLAARKFGQDFFNSGGHPTGVLMNEKPVNEDGAKRVKRRFLDALGGTREPAVFGDGWRYEQIQIAPNESQFLETVKANRADVAGFFKVPPGRIGAPGGSGMTYTNTEHEGIDLLRFCVGPWVTRMETTLTGLTVRPEYVKVNVDALLKTDLLTRYQAHDVAIRGGWRNVDDVREIEDEPPLPNGEGQKYLWPPYTTTPPGTAASPGAPK